MAAGARDNVTFLPHNFGVVLGLGASDGDACAVAARKDGAMGVHREWIRIAEIEPAPRLRRKTTTTEWLLLAAVVAVALWVASELVIRFA